MPKPLSRPALDALAAAVAEHPAFQERLRALVGRLAAPPATTCWPGPGTVAQYTYDAANRLTALGAGDRAPAAPPHDPAPAARRARRRPSPKRPAPAKPTARRKR